MLILADLAGVLAGDLSPLKPEYTKSALEGASEAWAYGDCILETRSLVQPFDSTLATTVEWLFIDANNRDHDLTVTAEAWYRDMSNDNIYIIPTSVTLNMHISSTYQLSISTSDGGTTDPVPGNYTKNCGEVVTVTPIPDSDSGYWFDCWCLDGKSVYGNPLTVTMNSDHTLKAYFKRAGGCPTLFVWDGAEYAEEGLLDIHADSDVTVQHEIMNILALEKGVYKLQLRELDDYTSHIDQVRLYAVDYEGERHSCPLTYAYHNELGKVKQTLRFDDDNRVDLKPMEMISLEFAPPISYDKTAHFIFEINGYNSKWPGGDP